MYKYKNGIKGVGAYLIGDTNDPYLVGDTGDHYLTGGTSDPILGPYLMVLVKKRIRVLKN